MTDVSTHDLPLADSGGCGDGCTCGAGEDAEYMECGLDPALAELLADAGLDPLEVEDIANVAIQEDLAGGVDVTTVATIPEEAVATADFTAREAGVVAGLRVAEAVVSVVCTDEFEVERHVEDGDRVEAGQTLLSVTTRTRDLLTAERSALNLLCVARVLVTAAARREETRGCHWREDHADRDDSAWRRHIVVRLNPDRTLAVHTTDTADFPPTRQHRPQEQ